MTETATTGPAFVRLDAAAAAAALRAAPEQAARGLFGLDPVTQNDALLIREIERLGVEFYAGGRELYGVAPVPEQPRQARVATTSGEPEPLRALLGFLRTYRRCTSFAALVPEHSPARPAFECCGFVHVGTLKDQLYQSGAYRDVLVYHANGDDTCRP